MSTLHVFVQPPVENFSENASAAGVRRPSLRMPAGMWPSLTTLSESYQFARELDRSVWDFACRLGTLRKLGLTDNRCRWLLCNGLARQANETTQPGDAARSFELFDGLVFSRNTCLVLTAAGAAWWATNSTAGSIGETVVIRLEATENGIPQPRWDGNRRELSVGGWVVKCFRVPAPNQERLLEVFEEEGWPVHIDDPLPADRLLDHKRRLHDTINALNRHQKHRLLHFRGDGRGEGVRWERLDDSNLPSFNP